MHLLRHNICYEFKLLYIISLNKKVHKEHETEMKILRNKNVEQFLWMHSAIIS